MRKLVLSILTVCLLFSCKEEVKLSFSELNTTHSTNTNVEINIPNANGDSKVSEMINYKLSNHIINELNFGDDKEELTLEEAILKFDNEYTSFKDEFEDSQMIWEASFDGEVIYESGIVICIALTSYTFTGGAHGNMNITLYNFNPQTGALYLEDDLIEDGVGFTALAKTQFDIEIVSQEDNPEDFFFEEEFHLPANIGFNEEGVLLLYNTYEIASYAAGLTEFTIPYDKAESFLKLF